LYKVKLCPEWDDIHNKCSHRGKLLADHINEVKRNVKELLKFYGNFPEISFDIAEYLAEYHDYGKLCKEWAIDKERPPPHSPWSLQWLMDHKKKFEPKLDLTLILWYFILKHHSKLNYYTSSSKEHRFIVEYIRDYVPKLSFEEKINLVDVFGLFKIGDILSAKNNRIFIPESPLITEESIKKIIDNSMIPEKWDPERWKQQLALKGIGNIGLLRAYTGWGKTTASLLFFVNKKSIRKIFYLLPTTTAINKFYDKLLKSFPNKVSKYFYFYDAEISENQDKLNELFFAKNFLTPLVITTVDQFLLSFLQYSRYPTKRVMFRGAGLIIDEVHLLNPLMLMLTTYFMRKYSSLYKIKALFMSATLPNALSRYLSDKLMIPKKNFLDYSKEYYERKRIMLAFSSKPIENDVDKIVEYAEKRNKILIIVNTVGKAIEIARILGEYIPKDKIILLHSRFMYRDRKEKENEIEKKTKNPHILVSTQISEVSLDISYDLLFTEVSSLPSIIQRFGRVNRYGKKVNQINTYLYKPMITNEFYYPYSLREIDLAEKVAKEAEGEKLKNEGQLLDAFNSEYSYEDFMKEISNVKKKVDLEAFEKRLNFFFSLDIREEKLMKILSYRGAFNALIIPAPSCIRDVTLRENVKNLILQFLTKMDLQKKGEIIAKIKNFCLPVPIWWLNKEKNKYNSPYPIIAFEDRVYDRYYGLVESEKI
jgi:CRISPR-associated endonuclease/helicase Cas3